MSPVPPGSRPTSPRPPSSPPPVPARTEPYRHRTLPGVPPGPVPAALPACPLQRPSARLLPAARSRIRPARPRPVPTPRLPAWTWPAVAVLALLLGLTGGALAGALVAGDGGTSASEVLRVERRTAAPLPADNVSIAAVAEKVLPEHGADRRGVRRQGPGRHRVGLRARRPGPRHHQQPRRRPGRRGQRPDRDHRPGRQPQQGDGRRAQHRLRHRGAEVGGGQEAARRSRSAPPTRCGWARPSWPSARRSGSPPRSPRAS